MPRRGGSMLAEPPHGAECPGGHVRDHTPTGAPRATETRTVATRVREAMDSLSPGERRVARALLAHYPAAGLETTVGLAERANVSGPTVIRFASRLGFAGYKEFQATLRREIEARQASPLSLTHRAGEAGETDDILDAASHFISDIEATMRAIPASELRDAVDLLANKRNHLATMGGRFSGVLAEYLHLHLKQMRPRAALLRTPDDAATALIDLDKEHVLVVFDFRRYQDDIVGFAREAAQRGARIILITDTWMSPISEVADVVLPVAIEFPSPFDSYVAATGVVELVVAALHRKLGTEANARMAAYDDAGALLSPKSVDPTASDA